MSDVDTDYSTSNIVRAGQVVVLHRRWLADRGADECLGIFRAIRDFNPAAEHAKFCADYPDYGPQTKWTATDRADWVAWACSVAGFIQEITPAYLFIEPWPEKPEQPAPEKVAHGD